MELIAGQVVCSRAGRDVTKAYLVAQVLGERAMLVDGEKRPLQCPKAKNPRHIQPTKIVLAKNQWDTDEKIRSVLAAYLANRTKGG